MNKIMRRTLLVFFAFLAISLALKGMDLWSIGSNVDGDGIGVSFLGMEVDDQGAAASIPAYSAGFFGMSAAAFLIAFVLGRIELQGMKK